MLRTFRFAVVIVAVSTASSQLAAAPCSGFVDVEDTDLFCPNVDWVRNRGITLGCRTNEYCPNDNVTRLQMAAFLNRLGTAMTPVQLRADEHAGALDLDLAPVVCKSPPFTTTIYPRRAVVDATFHATAGGDVSLGAEAVMSVDGGASWGSLNTDATRAGSISAGRWSGIPVLGHADLVHPTEVRFGIRASRLAFSGPVDLIDSQCQLRVLIFSRDGTAPPF